MQRELRFRMWSNEKCFKTENNKLVEKDGCYISTVRIETRLTGELFDLHGEDVTIEQYIGLNDIDGVPIYENDIVEAEIYKYTYAGSLSAVGSTSIKGTVTFNQGGWYIGEYPCYKSMNIKVVGNIHE